MLSFLKGWLCQKRMLVLEEIIMTKPSELLDLSGNAFFVAKLLLLLELKKTHGEAFASAFLDEFPIEVSHAYELAQHHE